MADVGVWMTQKAWPSALCEGRHPIRLGNRSPEACPHNIFPTRDHRLVAIAVETTAQWDSLVALLGQKGLDLLPFAKPANRLPSVDAIEQIVSQWTSALDSEHIAELCQARGIPASVVRDLAELVSDPDVNKRHMIVDVVDPIGGRIRLLGSPLALSRTPPVIEAGAPMLGEHTREILMDWLDFSADKVDALAAAGTIVARESTIRTPAAANALNP